MKSALHFTGERLVPSENAGQALYYEHLARYLFASNFSENKNVLDLGCGSGYGSYILKKNGKAKLVTGIDISLEAINYAKVTYNIKNLVFRVGDVSNLSNLNPRSFDLIACFEVIEHILYQKSMIAGVVNALKNNGIFLVSTPNTLTYPKGNKFHLKELSPANFQKLLKSKFKFVKFLYQNYFLSEEIFDQNENESLEIIKSEKLIKQNVTNFKVIKDKKNCEYLMAVCSNSPLPLIPHLSISLDKVNEFNLKNGFLSLSEQFTDLINQLNELKENETECGSKIYKELEMLKTEHSEILVKLSDQKSKTLSSEAQYNQIINSKFYKSWQIFRKLINLFK